MFDPDSLKEEAKTFSVERSRLSQDELLEYGKLATELRARFRAKAAAMEPGDSDGAGEDELELPASVKKLERGCKKERQLREGTTG